ncbi:MAG: hypothetical protein K2Y71_29210 [Xanthobacteraceae bacterium]|nr:hypothetical protein [Xanthobacteraceae bacterium]
MHAQPVIAAPSGAAPPPEPAAYTVDEFCVAHRFSRETLYALWRKGLGPARFKALSRTLISKEAAAAWRRQREKAEAANGR